MSQGKRLKGIALAALVCTQLCLPTAASAGRWDRGACLFGLADVRDPPRFEAYPARFRSIVHPAHPILASRDTRRFRTVLRDAAAEGPNFAGHYKLAVWGCGSSCTAFGMIDSVSGRSFISPHFRIVATNHTLDSPLVFRPDSRLLVLTGAPNEEDAREGVWFLDWNGATLRPVRFVPSRPLCPSAGR